MEAPRTGRKHFQGLLGFLINAVVYDLSMSLPTYLCLTHRAQSIVGFSHKILIQPLEHELGHSLKRQKVGQEGCRMVYSGPASK